MNSNPEEETSQYESIVLIEGFKNLFFYSKKENCSSKEAL